MSNELQADIDRALDRLLAKLADLRLNSLELKNMRLDIEQLEQTFGKEKTCQPMNAK